MRKDLARARRRAMQASGDDATIVVGLPVTRPVGQANGNDDGGRAFHGRSAAYAGPAAARDIGAVSHLATDRGRPWPGAPGRAARVHDAAGRAVVGGDHLRARRRSPSRDRSSAGHAPVSAALSASVTDSDPGTVRIHRPPPCRHRRCRVSSPFPVLDGSGTRGATSPVDEGPVPIPLPAVPSSGIHPLPTAGRATVDAPVIASCPRPLRAAGRRRRSRCRCEASLAAAHADRRSSTAGSRAWCRPGQPGSRRTRRPGAASRRRSSSAASWRCWRSVSSPRSSRSAPSACSRDRRFLGCSLVPSSRR